MDILKKYNIAHKGLSAGHHSFEFQTDDAFFDAFEGTEIIGGSTDVHVDAEKGAGVLSLHFDINGSVRVECDRCLEEVELPVEFHGGLRVKFSDEISDYDGEVMWINPSDSEIDLAQYIYESIVLSLPYRKIHGLDSEGNSLCDPEMLSRFSIVTEEEFEAMEEQKPISIAEAEGAEKLLELKKQMER